jgi:NTE family protein
MKQVKEISNFDALQIILTCDNRSEKYELAIHQLANTKIFEKDVSDLLKTLFNKKTLPSLPISSEQLLKLPNLFYSAANSYEYNLLVKELHKILDKNKVLSEYVLDHFYTTLEQIGVNNIQEDLTFTILSLLLKSYYNLPLLSMKNEEKQAFKEQVKYFLSGKVIGLNEKFERLTFSLTILKNYLSSNNKNLRFKARGICESLQIPLNLETMIKLSVDGVTIKNTDSNIEDIILFVGGTGAGKSTTINYLYGVEYEFKKNISTGDVCLQATASNQDIPAKVGHGSKSQTLYPQNIITQLFDKNVIFCDSPGFEDNRDDDQSICASLGVPLAIHHAKCVRAVVVVLDHNSTYFNAGNRGKVFNELAKTLSRLIKIPDNGDIPILFAISRPPIPAREEIFDPNELRDQMVNRISEECANKEDYLSTLKKDESYLEQLNSRLQNINEILLGLSSLYIDDHQPCSKGTRIGRVLTTITGEREALAEGHIEIEVQAQVAHWRESEKLHEEAITKLQDILRNVLHMDQDSRLEEMDRLKEELTQEFNIVDNKIEKLEQKIKDQNGVQIILELMQNKENIFIIRGYNDHPEEDLPDHKDDMLNRLKELQQAGQKINRKKFIFNPNSHEFSKVRDWVDGNVFEGTKKLQGLLNLNRDYKKCVGEISEIEAEINNNKEQLQKEMKFEENNIVSTDKIDIVKKGIEKKEELIKSKDEEITKLGLGTTKAKTKIHKISTSPAVEYNSNKIIEKRNWVGRTFSWWTTWEYEFPGKYNKEDGTKIIIPIERVETSCVINAESRLVFITKLDSENNIDLYNCSVSNEGVTTHSPKRQIQEVGVLPGLEYVKKGNFIYTDCDLTKGILKIRYDSDGGVDGYAGIRVFVLPKNLPEYLDKIETLKIKIKNNKKQQKNNAFNIIRMQKEIEQDREYLSIIEKGFCAQEDKCERISQLLKRLGYTTNVFINTFFKEQESLIKWLIDDENIKKLEALLGYNNEQFNQEIKMSKKVFSLLLGKDASEELDKDYGMKEALCGIPENLLSSMHSFVENTGLTVLLLHKLLQQLNETASNSIFQYLEKLKDKQLVYEYCFNQLKKESCLQDKLKNEALINIIELFGASNRSKWSNFVSLNETIVSEGIAEIDYPLPSGDKEEATKNVVLRELSSYSRFYNLPGLQDFKDLKDFANKQMILAVCENTLDKVKDLSVKIPLTVADSNNLPLILISTISNSEDVVRYLLSSLETIDCAATDIHGNTAIHIAASLGHSNLINILCPIFHINQINEKNNQTPLHVAILNKQVDFAKNIIQLQNAKLELEASITINEQSFDMTPLQIAVMLGEDSIIEALFNTKRLQNHTKEHPKLGTLFHIAVYFNQKDILNNLLRKYSSNFSISLSQSLVETRDSAGLSILNLAAKLGHINIIEMLNKEHGANLITKDVHGNTPAHWAVWQDNEHVIFKLCELAGNKEVIDQDDNDRLRPVNIAVNQDNKKLVNILDLLLANNGRNTLDHVHIPSYENLVFQGGGPKGIAYVGALRACQEYKCFNMSEVKRVAGTSAGAITATLVALGFSPDELEKILSVTDLLSFVDGNEFKVPCNLKSTWELIRNLYILSKDTGISDGKTFRNWIEEQIKDKLKDDYKENMTLGDLADLIKSGKPYKHLYIIGTHVNDISGTPRMEIFSSENEKMRDYVISDLVRISMSIPGVFKPHHIYIRNQYGGCTPIVERFYVDGGVVNNFPIGIFDSKKYQPNSNSDMPLVFNNKTLGFSLFSEGDKERFESDFGKSSQEDIKTAYQVLKPVFYAIYNNELTHFNEADKTRTIFINNLGFATTNFALSDLEKNQLIEAGSNAVKLFFGPAIIQQLAVVSSLRASQSGHAGFTPGYENYIFTNQNQTSNESHKDAEYKCIHKENKM